MPSSTSTNPAQSSLSSGRPNGKPQKYLRLILMPCKCDSAINERIHMKKKLLVLADLGHFKAFRLEQNQNFSQPRLQLLEQWDTNVPRHLSEEVTDQAGQFRKGTVPAGPSNLSDGEEHNLDLERRRRALKTVATHLRELLNRKELDVDGCYFAASSEINGAIMEELDQHTRARIQKNVAANLTRLNPDQVISQFCQ